MKQPYVLIGVILILGLLCLRSQANAAEQKFTGSFAGSGVRTQIDTNADGMRAVAATGKGKTNMGPITYQGIGDSLPRLSAVSTCPQGTWEFPLLMYQSVLYFEESGELLYTHMSSGISCYDPNTNMLSFKGKGTFNGGTGKFAEATGSFESRTTSKMLLPTPTGNEFESIDGQFTGTLITP